MGNKTANICFSAILGVSTFVTICGAGSQTDEQSSPVPYHLAKLGNTDSQEALQSIQAYFRKHPDKRGWGAVALTYADPLRRMHWNYLRSEILPDLCRELKDNEIHATLMFFYDFSLKIDLKKPIRIEGFSWDEIQPHGRTFLDSLLSRPDFNRLMLQSYVFNLTKLTNSAIVGGFSEYELLLDICRAFGAKSQINLLNNSLAEFERALNDPTVISNWNWIFGKGSDGPWTHEQGLEWFAKSKAAAIHAMELRS